jgi:hypothetical protein
MAVKDIWNDMHDIYERWVEIASNKYAKMVSAVLVSADGTPIDGSNPVGVSLAASEEHIGQIGGEGITISQTPTITAGAYSAGDAVGGLLTFTGAGRVSAYGGVLTNVLLIDDAGQDAQLELWLFNQTFTAISDNAAWAPSEADLENLICVISSLDGIWTAAGTPSVSFIEKTIRYDLTGTNMFGQLVTRGTPTYVATDDLTVKVGLLQD